MAISENLLNDEEQVVLDLRPHWWFFIRQILVLFVALLFGVTGLVLGNNSLWSLVAGALLAIALVWFCLLYTSPSPRDS